MKSSRERPPSHHDCPTTETVLLREVLRLVLGERAFALTQSEITLALANGEDFGSKDSVARAIRDLVGAGVLRRNAESIVPTRATVYLDRLIEDGVP